MAGRLDYAVSVSPVQVGSALEGTTPEAVESDIGRSLGGGNSSTVWTGTLVGAGATSAGGWKAGAHTHIEANSNGFTQVGAVNDDMVWIKHTGKRYDSSTTDKLKADGTVDAVAVSIIGKLPTVVKVLAKVRSVTEPACPDILPAIVFVTVRFSRIPTLVMLG